MQTFTVALCGYALRTKKSTVSIIIYILLGLIGVPVFSGFNAGTAALFGKTGGFIFGFVFLVIACGIASTFKNTVLKILVGTAGLAICHIFGIMWFIFLTKMNFFAAAAVVSLPFIAKDIICVICAALLSERLQKLIK